MRFASGAVIEGQRLTIFAWKISGTDSTTSDVMEA